MRGLSPVVASGGHPSSRCAGLSPPRPLSPRSTGSRRAGSAAVAHGPSRSTACGILPGQGSNPCPPHQQADSQPLRHQGSPGVAILISGKIIDFKIKTITRDKEGHYIMIKGSIQEEDITIINIYAPNIGAPQYKANATSYKRRNRQ